MLEKISHCSFCRLNLSAHACIQLQLSAPLVKLVVVGNVGNVGNVAVVSASIRVYRPTSIIANLGIPRSKRLLAQTKGQRRLEKKLTVLIIKTGQISRGHIGLLQVQD